MHSEIITNLAADEYTRIRLHPDPRDYCYLHLSDLRLAVEKVASDLPMRVMDYGCGGSPYRALFPRATYHRADFVDVPGRDFKVQEDSLVEKAATADYDLILSSQVLEHVNCPENYLNEARRMLKCGGRLALSTHGIWPEHGCPHDYQRWTADGLRGIVERAGFHEVEIFKLTTGPRAVLQLAEDYWRQLSNAAHGPYGCLWKMLDRFFLSKTAQRNLWIDDRFSQCRIVRAAPEDSHILYVGLFLLAKKNEP